MKWYCYMVRCSDNSLYTGITTDLVRRMEEHNSPKSKTKYTRCRRPVKLAFSMTLPDRSSASKKEAYFKSLSKKEKEKYV